MADGSWAHGAEVRVVGEMHGSITNNVWHFATDQTINDGDLDQVLLDLAQAMLDCILTTLLPAVTQDWKVVRVEARRVHPVVGDPMVATAPPDSVGELSATSVSFAATLVNLRTNGGGRSGRGKKFLPPAGEGEIASSAIDAPTLALITTFLLCIGEKFMGATPTSEWTLGVFSRKNAGGLFSNFNTGFRHVQSLNPVANVAIMSSRKKGRGA